MWTSFIKKIRGVVAIGSGVGFLLVGCSLPIKTPAPQTTYRLESPTVHTSAITVQGVAQSVLIQMRPTMASQGFKTQAMMYSKDALNLEPYRDSRWLGPPATLITDAIQQTLIGQPWVSGVVPNSASAPVAVNLSCQLIRLEHDLSGNTGKAHLVMTCLWTNPAQRTVEAHWRFDQTEVVRQNNALGFVQATQTLLDQAVSQITVRTRSVIHRQLQQAN